MKSLWAAGHVRWFIKFDIIFILKSDTIHFKHPNIMWYAYELCLWELILTDLLFLGVNAMANINEFVAKLSAFDPDAGDNGSLSYYIRASNLFKYGSNLSRGSIIPSPFNVTEDGKLVTANYMAEYNQDRFVLDVIAKEKASPEREAMTKVHVRNSQCIVFILNYCIAD